MLRYLTAGESHGRALVVVLEGLPAGVPLTTAEVAAELARRRLGYGRGKRMRFEQDRCEVLGGLRHGRTLGSPLAVRIDNSEWPKWTEVMAPDPPADPAAAARALLAQVGVAVLSHVVRLGPAASRSRAL